MHADKDGKPIAIINSETKADDSASLRIEGDVGDTLLVTDLSEAAPDGRRSRAAGMKPAGSGPPAATALVEGVGVADNTVVDVHHPTMDNCVPRENCVSGRGRLTEVRSTATCTGPEA